MRAIVYSRTGGSEVLALVSRPLPVPGPGEVRVRVAVSGVNPTDWKSRAGAGAGQALAFPEQVPNQDGAGTIDAVGPGVPASRIGERVWVWEAAWSRPTGTAAEYLVVPDRQAVQLPDDASYDLGASLGIPALTAHRCLTIGQSGVDRLGPGALAGAEVLVTGGAGAVGHAAIQLARWAGAHVISTVSSPAKAELAYRAGAQHVVDYRSEDVVAGIRDKAPNGVDIVVEVNVAQNARHYADLVAPNATVASYAALPGDELTLSVRAFMGPNTRFQFVLVYSVPAAAKDHAVQDVATAVAAGALPVGEAHGLPLSRFPLERTGEAHDAVQAGAVGKVLIDLT